jgi:hypothetical protein
MLQYHSQQPVKETDRYWDRLYKTFQTQRANCQWSLPATWCRKRKRCSKAMLLKRAPAMRFLCLWTTILEGRGGNGEICALQAKENCARHLLLSGATEVMYENEIFYRPQSAVLMLERDEDL